ncbi:hypothetical protein JCM3766R1_000459, partial [Sporobolomyces carnicolor]
TRAASFEPADTSDAHRVVSPGPWGKFIITQLSLRKHVSMGDALLLVDVQNDFLPPRGSLAVPSGDLVVPHVLDLLSLPFAIVVASQDFHPANHVSFASSHPASQRRPFESIRLPHPVTRVESDQDLWPDHCVQDTSGAELEPRVSRAFETWVANGKGTLVRKGQDVELDAYSAFAKPLALLRQEHERQNHTDPPLTTILKRKHARSHDS